MSLALSSDAPPSAAELVNKSELAAILRVSLPTVSAWIERFADFPVVERGGNGREWAFDPAAVSQFIQAQRDAEAREEAARRERLAQFALPLTDPGDATAAGSDAFTLEDIRRIQAADKLRQERGFLVSVPELRQVLTAAAARWNRAVHAASRQVARDFGLPDAVARALVDKIGEAQRQFVRDLGADAGLIDDSDDERRTA